MAVLAGKQRCLFCCNPVTGGIRILEDVICPECEEKIVASSAGEASYADYVQKIKRAWREALGQETVVSIRELDN